MAFTAILSISAAFGTTGQSAQAKSAIPDLQPDDPAWELCRSAAQDVNKAAGLPDNLLSAIAVTESGIRTKGRDEVAPWPWTINAAGTGYRYASKAEAIAAVPNELVDAVHLVGPADKIRDRLQAWKEAGKRCEVAALQVGAMQPEALELLAEELL